MPTSLSGSSRSDTYAEGATWHWAPSCRKVAVGDHVAKDAAPHASLRLYDVAQVGRGGHATCFLSRIPSFAGPANGSYALGRARGQLARARAVTSAYRVAEDTCRWKVHGPAGSTDTCPIDCPMRGRKNRAACFATTQPAATTETCPPWGVRDFFGFGSLGGGGRGRETEKGRRRLGMEKSPRDLLRRFVGNGVGEEPTEMVEGDSDEIELSLGLSLGGCFGAERKGKKLVRSTSVASFLTLPKEPEFPAVPVAALTRTSSLPSETEEDLRKRKQMQSLKRLEAKRKRLERKNSIRSPKPGLPGEKHDEDAVGAKVSTVAAGAAHGMVNHGHLGLTCAKGGVAPPDQPTWLVGLPPRKLTTASISQGSSCSQGSCASIATNSESPATHGLNSMIPLANSHTKNDETVMNPPISWGGKTMLNPGREGRAQPMLVTARSNGVKELEKKMIETMPFVSTKGNGPNGHRIQGFLYKYRKGEEVRIVCVCHGSFLTPAEFVEHAGGLDVANPLRHIVVSPSPFTL
ncbi:hypothetical protein ZIOFF_035648 [Zingiber officinale]|uniref:Ninja-family protein n=2 Tax=Zingiber officinale TaxID=94328 RepID=A0A8J5L2T8_ZINOF|nr:hypothetical protein ZIOFF_035648 [Zingiber officinale]